jgi:hypothetical protein
MVNARFSSYSSEFFDDMERGALGSAEVVLPLVFDLIRPSSIVDVGCGRGAWLRIAMELGIPEVQGLDGGYVDRQKLLIPSERFQATDLSRPFRAPRTYDLALCLEVAEHLPKRAALSLVEGLTAAAPVVLFSAAIPGQPGTRHINPQFPEYWWRLFAARGFVALDALRPRIRSEASVEPWYAQNLLLYVERDYYERSARLRDYPPVNRPDELLPWVYAGIWRGRVRWRGPLSILKLLLENALRRS